MMPLPLKSSQQLSADCQEVEPIECQKNAKFFANYQTFVMDLISPWAQRAPLDRLEVQDGKVNYVTSRVSTHKQQPCKQSMNRTYSYIPAIFQKKKL